MDEPTLLAALADDLDLAFEALVRSRQDRVFSIALRILGDPTDAEDVAQDAFVRAYRALGAWPAARIRELRLDAWLATIVVNTARSRIRRRARTAARIPDVRRRARPSPVDPGRARPMAGWPGPRRPRRGRSGSSRCPSGTGRRSSSVTSTDSATTRSPRPSADPRARSRPRSIAGSASCGRCSKPRIGPTRPLPPTRLPPAARAARTTSHPPATLRRTPLPSPSSRRSPDDRIARLSSTTRPWPASLPVSGRPRPTRSCPGR